MTTLIVVDASAGVEIVTSTERGRRLARLVPEAAELWVPEHFYSEVFASIRYLHIVAGKLTLQRARRPSNGSLDGISARSDWAR